MFGITQDEFWDLLIGMVDVVPMDYQGGDLDAPTSDCLLDMLGYTADKLIGYSNMSGIMEADWQVFQYEMVQVAMDIRLILPPRLAYLQFREVTPKLLFITAMQLPTTGFDNDTDEDSMDCGS